MPLALPAKFRPRSFVIGPAAHEAIGPLFRGINTGGVANTAWPSVNMAIYYPFVLPEPGTAVFMWCYNGITQNGNVDVGLFAADGTKLVSSGATATSGASVLQTFDITDTQLQANTVYYAGMSSSSATGTFFSWTGSINIGQLSAVGCLQMASAQPLANATFAAFSTANVLPAFGLSFLTTF